jgi:hypothetical protein
MTFATFPRELFAIPELKFDRPIALFADESKATANTDARELTGSARALADARKIFRAAKSRYGWSDLEIENLLHKFHEDSSFDGLDSIARTLIFAEASYSLARLAEKSSDFSFWLNLSPNQREVLFSSAIQLHDDLPKSNQLNSRNLLVMSRDYLWSFLFNVNFSRFCLDSLDSGKKIIDNAARMETIFEKQGIKQARVLNFSNMTQTERDAAIEHYKNIRQANIDRLTLAEIQKSDRQFEDAFKMLDESREKNS